MRYGVTPLLQIVLATLGLVASSLSAWGQPSGTDLPSGIPWGLDHASIAVGDLDAAEALFEKLGFTIKPGLPHKNSIANGHLEFVDGTELELITAREPRDSLAAEYLRYVGEGDGGAFVALRVRVVDSLAARLSAAGFPVRISRSTGMRALVFPEGHPLRPVWFLEFLRPYVDRPVYTTHRNRARRLRAVWLSSSQGERIELLFDALDIVAQGSDWPVPGSRVLSLGTSQVVLIPTQEPPLRPFVGATIEVFELDATASVLRAQGFAFTRHEDARGTSLQLTLPELSGFILEFFQPSVVPPPDPTPRDVVPHGRP